MVSTPRRRVASASLSVCLPRSKCGRWFYERVVCFAVQLCFEEVCLCSEETCSFSQNETTLRMDITTLRKDTTTLNKQSTTLFSKHYISTPCSSASSPSSIEPLCKLDNTDKRLGSLEHRSAISCSRGSAANRSSNVRIYTSCPQLATTGFLANYTSHSTRTPTSI